MYNLLLIYSERGSYLYLSKICIYVWTVGKAECDLGSEIGSDPMY